MEHAFCFISVYLLSTPKSQLSSSFLSVRLILASSSLWIIICVRVYLLFSCGYSLPPQLHFLCGEVFNYMPCLVFVFLLFFLWDSLLFKKNITTLIYLFCECACSHACISMPQGKWRSKVSRGHWFSSFTLWIQETELRLLGPTAVNVCLDI